MTKAKHILLLVLINFIFLLPLFRSPFIKTHDGEANVARFAAYIKTISDFEFPPRWAGDLHFGYGSIELGFYYPLSGYIATFLNVFNLSLEMIFKVVTAYSFISSSIYFYFWISKKISLNAAFIGSVFYGLSPYRFLNLYVRGDQGELLALSFVPLILYFIDLYFAKRESKYIIGTGIFFGLLVLSHNGISLLFTPFLILYTFYFHHPRISLPFVCKFTVLGLGISCYFWLPILYEMRYMATDFLFHNYYMHHFPNFTQLIYSPWGFGANVTNQNGLSPEIGPLHFIAAFIATLTILYKRDKMYVFYVIILYLGIFITLKQSSILWQYVPLLNKLQFPWRLTAITSFCSSILISYLFTFSFHKSIKLVLILLLLANSVRYTQTQTIDSKPNSFYYNYKASTTYHGEVVTKWIGSIPSKPTLKPIEIIGGNGTITSYSRNQVTHTFTTVSRDNLTIADHTLYYPGWHVYIDKKLFQNIQFQDPNHKGILVYNIPEGQHEIEVKFEETKLRLFSDYVSIICICYICYYVILNQGKL